MNGKKYIKRVKYLCAAVAMFKEHEWLQGASKIGTGSITVTGKTGNLYSLCAAIPQQVELTVNMQFLLKNDCP